MLGLKGWLVRADGERCSTMTLAYLIEPFDRRARDLRTLAI
jgi:hypothetical protein